MTWQSPSSVRNRSSYSKTGPGQWDPNKICTNLLRRQSASHASLRGCGVFKKCMKVSIMKNCAWISDTFCTKINIFLFCPPQTPWSVLIPGSHAQPQTPDPQTVVLSSTGWIQTVVSPRTFQMSIPHTNTFHSKAPQPAYANNPVKVAEPQLNM